MPDASKTPDDAVKVKLLPEILTVKIGSLEVYSTDGFSWNTEVRIDGTPWPVRAIFLAAILGKPWTCELEYYPGLLTRKP